MRYDKGQRVRRREVQCFWAGIATAFVVAAQRAYVTLRPMGSGDWITVNTWATNAFILWALTLFVLAWLFWRDARRRQDELETVVRSIVPDVLLVRDEKDIVWMCNPAAQTMFGFSPGELAGHAIRDLLTDRPATATEQELYGRLRSSGFEVKAATGLRKDGSRFPAEVTTARLVQQKGAVLLVRDTTERSQVEQMRESLNRMLAHDLRNPLFTIGGNMHLLMALAPDLSDEARALVLAALESARDIEELLRCLSDVTLLETATRSLKLSDSDLGGMVDKGLATLATLIREKRHAVTWSPTTAVARCDAELIERVVLNLLRNAAEATPSGGQIGVRIASAPDRFRVSVSDNGPGVPPEFQRLIFEKFGQTADGRRSQRRACGVGLFFCKLAVEAHGGAIGVQSDTDRSSAFWFELPVRRAGASA